MIFTTEKALPRLYGPLILSLLCLAHNHCEQLLVFTALLETQKQHPAADPLQSLQHPTHGCGKCTVVFLVAGLPQKTYFLICKTAPLKGLPQVSSL